MASACGLTLACSMHTAAPFEPSPSLTTAASLSSACHHSSSLSQDAQVCCFVSLLHPLECEKSVPRPTCFQFLSSRSLVGVHCCLRVTCGLPYFHLFDVAACLCAPCQRDRATAPTHLALSSGLSLRPSPPQASLPPPPLISRRFFLASNDGIAMTRCRIVDLPHGSGVLEFSCLILHLRRLPPVPRFAPLAFASDDSRFHTFCTPVSFPSFAPSLLLVSSSALTCLSVVISGDE